MDGPTSHRLTLHDLPNELLLLIIKRLPMVDVFDSLVGVTQRLDQLVLNPIYTCTLDLTRPKVDVLPERSYLINLPILSRVCRDVLPRIHQHVTHLTLEQRSIGRVFRGAQYPQLRSLSLKNVDEELFIDFWPGEKSIFTFLEDQIESLAIHMKYEATKEPPEYFWWMLNFFAEHCRQLTKVHFYPLTPRTPRDADGFVGIRCESAILTELKISVRSFDDCLYFLLGNFPSLSTLMVHVEDIARTDGWRFPMRSFPKIRCFSLSSYRRTCHYNTQIVPLLQCMVNLEELTLFLHVLRFDSNYIDGALLRDDVLRHMPRLNQFNFSIETQIIKLRNYPVLSTNEEIQHSFGGGRFGPVGSHVDVRTRYDGVRAGQNSPMNSFCNRCAVYSLPYAFDYFPFLSNTFREGTFQRVQLLAMADARPFEHEFFRIISRSFPRLTQLRVFNTEPQEDKQQSRTPMIFAQLTRLDFKHAHADYAEQFLDNQHCHLPRLSALQIRYDSLASATSRFTSDATRLTCSKLYALDIRQPFVRPEQFDEYFPSLRYFSCSDFRQ